VLGELKKSLRDVRVIRVRRITDYNKIIIIIINLRTRHYIIRYLIE
jgi:hypothetical protein